MISYIIQSVFGVILAVVVIFTFQGEPNEPPSKMATVDRDDDIIGTFRLLMIDKAFLKVSFVFWFYYTALLTSRANLFLVAEDFGYSDSEAWIFLNTFLLGGIVGTFSAGVILNKYRWYK